MEPWSIFSVRISPDDDCGAPRDAVITAKLAPVRSRAGCRLVDVFECRFGTLVPLFGRKPYLKAISRANPAAVMRRLRSKPQLIDIGRPSQALPVTPPCVRVRTRRVGEKS